MAERHDQGEKRPALSVVIPVYNEEESLPPLVDSLCRVLDGLEMGVEVIFIDDGSTDSSLEVMKRLKAQRCPYMRILAFSRNAGQSAAFVAGFRASRGNLFATLDADLQNDPSDIPLLLKALNGYDLVCGWRRHRQDPWIRKFSTNISNGFRRFVLKDGFHDTACSMRVFSRECIEGLVWFNGMHRFLPTLVKTRGYRVGEVVVKHHKRKYGEAKYNIRNRLLKAFVDLFGVLWLRSRWIQYQIKSEE